MHPVTLWQLHEWHKSAFEKLGWMTLAAKDQESADKIPMYFKELEHLRNSLKNKLSLTEENDRKADLLILHDHVIILESAAKKLFSNPTSGARKKK